MRNRYLYRISRYLGLLLKSASERIINYSNNKLDQFECFTTPDAIAINKARLEHLASCELDPRGKSVLEVGGGIGLLTKFFEDLGCSILTTDSRRENLAQITKRWPHRKLQVLDLDQTSDLSYLGSFDVIFCYGVLYHLSQPEQVLACLSSICREMILLETIVTFEDGVKINFVKEPNYPNQAISGIGCRPTRRWVIEMLRKYWGYAYITKTQPRHKDFDLCWVSPISRKKSHRAVFVGAKIPLQNRFLCEEIPDYQTYWSKSEEENALR